MLPHHTNIGRHRRVHALLALVAISSNFLLGGCDAVADSTSKKPVCQKPAAKIAIVAHTSKSDLAMSREIVDKIAEPAIKRAVDSCGLLMVGLMGGKSAVAELSLHVEQLQPSKTETYGDPEPILEPLKATARQFVEKNLTDPLNGAAAKGGSPYLNGLAQIAGELETRNLTGMTVVLVGDGLAVEDSPDGERVNFYREPINLASVMQFAPLLKPLRGSCVVLVSAPTPGISDQQIRDAHSAFQQVLERIGAEFDSISSTSDVPWDC